MVNIFKFPIQQSSKKDFIQVRKRRQAKLEDMGQLNLFRTTPANIFQLNETSYFEQALLLDDQNDRDAQVLYQKSIDANEAVADSYCNLGIIQSKRDEHIKAFDCFTKALHADSRHIESHYNLANLYFDTGQLNLAQFHYESALSIKSTFGNAIFNLALLHIVREDLITARQLLLQFLEIAPANDYADARDLVKAIEQVAVTSST
jgi:tetratricopeptide (TPR) repeat protein